MTTIHCPHKTKAQGILTPRFSDWKDMEDVFRHAFEMGKKKIAPED